MEVKHRRYKVGTRLRNMSLKWSFVLYVGVGVLLALLISMICSGYFSKVQNDLYHYYEEMYREELGQQGDIVVDGDIVQENALWFYTENLQDKYSPEDERLDTFCQIMTVLIVPIVCVICLVITGIVFYLRKLKVPLAILDAASSRIASGDLDFKVEYDINNEFGRLTQSFETMRKSLYQNNREMWKMIEGRQRLNAAFAHDLRTPLTVLRGYNDFLLQYLPEGKIDNKKAISTLTMMGTYINRLEGYTISMSSLQKLEEIEVSTKTIAFSTLCEQLRSSANQLVEDKELCFEYDTDDTEQSKSDLQLDTAIVFQVFENIVANATRYAQKRVNITCSEENNILTIIVSDDGAGFSEEALKKATNPYYRGEKDVDGEEHFGIGLYICGLLCEKHGGSLRLENDDGGKVYVSFISQP